jgi:beta-phosphoglucomutase-like phosphatase (HAD superfamily)
MPDTAPLPPFTAILFGLSGCLVDFGAKARAPDLCEDVFLNQPVQLTPSALQALERLHARQVPCAWLEELPAYLTSPMGAALPDWLTPAPSPAGCRPWPAPDACWHALMALGAPRLAGCVLVSGEPQLLRAGLAAGLWTIGLASCGSLCGLSSPEWLTLDNKQREYKRGQATLQLFDLGVHSVIDHLEALEGCLEDIALRRFKGEKP